MTVNKEVSSAKSLMLDSILNVKIDRDQAQSLGGHLLMCLSRLSKSH